MDVPICEEILRTINKYYNILLQPSKKLCLIEETD